MHVPVLLVSICLVWSCACGLQVTVTVHNCRGWLANQSLSCIAGSISARQKRLLWFDQDTYCTTCGLQVTTDHVHVAGAWYSLVVLVDISSVADQTQCVTRPGSTLSMLICTPIPPSTCKSNPHHLASFTLPLTRSTLISVLCAGW